jgi:spermidine/putrescine transport system permease protein
MNKRLSEYRISAPSFLWLLILFFIPTAIVIIISFRTRDAYGGAGADWTLDNYLRLVNPQFLKILVRTVWLSLQTTFICLVFGLPVAYTMSRAGARTQQNLMLAVIIPFWTNFLIRIFAWKGLLHPDGFLKQILVFLNLMKSDASLLYTEGAVLAVLVYTYLPFAILPLYAASEKFDFRLLEAARDLGSGPIRAFFTVYLPNISQGIFSAILVVFIPALGSYVIPEMVGGPKSEMLGNKIAQRVFTDRNLPEGSAISTLLILLVLLPLLFQLIYTKTTSLGKGRL